MQLQKTISFLLGQISDVVSTLTNQQYAGLMPVLSNNSIGQHLRHVIEMYECLIEGYDSGLINYEKRKRQQLIENSTEAAIMSIKSIVEALSQLEDKLLELELCFDVSNDETIRLSTNYHRELAYNIEHTIHHMALIRIGLKEIGFQNIPTNFGIAPSTVKFRNQCAQ